MQILNDYPLLTLAIARVVASWPQHGALCVYFWPAEQPFPKSFRNLTPLADLVPTGQGNVNLADHCLRDGRPNGFRLSRWFRHETRHGNYFVFPEGTPGPAVPLGVPHPRNTGTPIPRGWEKATEEKLKPETVYMACNPWKPGGWGRFVLPASSYLYNDMEILCKPQT